MQILQFILGGALITIGVLTLNMVTYEQGRENPTFERGNIPRPITFPNPTTFTSEVPMYCIDGKCRFMNEISDTVILELWNSGHREPALEVEMLKRKLKS